MSESSSSSLQLISGYRFSDIDHPARQRDRIRVFADARGLKGTVIVAAEGLNFSLAGREAALDQWLEWIAGKLGCDDAVVNRQPVPEPPFLRLKVKLKDELVKFDRDVRPTREHGGRAVSPGRWNALIRRDDVQLVDTRNDYEVGIGTFEGAVDPGTTSFADFKSFCLNELDPQRPVAMFCTGGVRCEKASAWLESRGFSRVFHLHGGILGYLAQTPPNASLWRGECFVFDDRVSVDGRLRPTGRVVCRGCRKPAINLDAAGVPPVSEDGTCGSCGRVFEDDRLAGLRERARQVELAGSRGERHLGPEAQSRVTEGRKRR
jgi:UPF0176 protein